MNGQNNNYNSSMNNQSQQPTQPVRNKFFAQDMYSGANINDVGSSTSNMASNSVGGQVISWGVGGNKTNNVPNSPVNSGGNMQNDRLFEFQEEEPLFHFGEQQNINNVANVEMLSEGMLQDVNGVVYMQEQPEVLDFEINGQGNNLGMQNNGGWQQNNINNQPDQFGYNNQNMGNIQPMMDNRQMMMSNNQPMMPDNQQMMLNNQMAPNIQQFPNNQQGYDNQVAANPEIIHNDVLGQQPMSMNTLGNENLVRPDELNDNQFDPNSRFFDNNMVGKNFENMQNNTEFRKQQMLQKIPARKKNPNVLDSRESTLISAYIGSKAQKIQMSPFSLWAFLFGSFYFMFRKLFLIGALVYVIEMLALLLVPGLYRFIAFGFVRLLEALIFDAIYFKVVRGRVKRLEKKNPKRTLYDMSGIASKKGGTSFILALIVNVIVSGIAGSLMVVILGAQFFVDLYENVIPDLQESVKPQEDDTYKIKYSDFDVSQILNYKIPEGFVLQEGTPKKYVYRTDGGEVYNTCEVSLSVIDGKKSSEAFIREIILEEGSKDRYDSANTAGVTWYTLYTEDGKGALYRRSADIAGKVVFFEYVSGINTPKGVCDSYIVEILDSMSLKED